MNICIVSPFPLYAPPYSYVGACETWWKDLSRRHNIFAISSSIPNHNAKRYVHGTKIKDVRVRSVFLPNIPYAIPDPKEIFNVLVRIDKEEGIDLVHVIKIFFVSALFGAICTKRTLGRPLVSSIHGTYEYVHGTMVRALAEIYKKTAARTIISLSDRVIVLSPSLSSMGLTLGACKEKIMSIPIGPDLRRFEPRDQERAREKLSLPLDRTVILYLGSLRPIKGIFYLTRAAKRLLAIRDDFLFVFAGDGPARNVMAEQTRTFRKNVLFTGYVTNVEEYLAASDIVVLPSLSEGLPMSLLEAQAMKKCVVATDVGGIPDVIRDGENGLLVRPMDIDALAESILHLADNHELRQEMGERGRRIVEEKFCAEVISSRIERLYEDTCKNVAKARCSKTGKYRHTLGMTR